MSTAPVLVHRPLPSNLIGGQFPLDVTGNDLVKCGEWTSGDELPRKVTVTVTGRVTSTSQNVVLAARVTVGAGRTQFVQWFLGPNVVPLVAHYVRVDLLLVASPGLMFLSPGAQRVDFAPGKPAAGDVTAAVGFAQIGDEWSDVPPPAVLFNGNLSNATNDAPVIGPAYITAISLTNTSASAVSVAIYDTSRGWVFANMPPTRTQIIVPATSTIAIGSELLGAYFAGCQIAPVTLLVGGVPTFDFTGAADTVCTVTGNLYPFGGT